MDITTDVCERILVIASVLGRILCTATATIRDYLSQSLSRRVLCDSDYKRVLCDSDYKRASVAIVVAIVVAIIVAIIVAIVVAIVVAERTLCTVTTGDYLSQSLSRREHSSVAVAENTLQCPSVITNVHLNIVSISHKWPQI